MFIEVSIIWVLQFNVYWINLVLFEYYNSMFIELIQYYLSTTIQCLLN